MIVVEFFRDVLDGIWYWLYLLVCIILFFYVLGIVADNKREKINKKLKEKKSYDIESGKEAAIAAMETKQVLAVNEENKAVETTPEPTAVSSTPPVVKEEPIVINSTQETPNVVQSVEPEVVPVVQPVTPPTVTPMEQARNEEPLVINSNQ